MGEGAPPVPIKLAARIRQGEYIDMEELLPEFWAGAPQEEDGEAKKARRSQKVTDIFTWVQWFRAHMVVRAAQRPKAQPELIAYMNTIVRAGLGAPRCSISAPGSHH
jgi:hypothetical protein